MVNWSDALDKKIRAFSRFDAETGNPSFLGDKLCAAGVKRQRCDQEYDDEEEEAAIEKRPRRAPSSFSFSCASSSSSSSSSSKKTK